MWLLGLEGSPFLLLWQAAYQVEGTGSESSQVVRPGGGGTGTRRILLSSGGTFFPLLGTEECLMGSISCLFVYILDFGP